MEDTEYVSPEETVVDEEATVEGPIPEVDEVIEEAPAVEAEAATEEAPAVEEAALGGNGYPATPSDGQPV